MLSVVLFDSTMPCPVAVPCVQVAWGLFLPERQCRPISQPHTWRCKCLCRCLAFASKFTLQRTTAIGPLQVQATMTKREPLDASCAPNMALFHTKNGFLPQKSEATPHSRQPLVADQNETPVSRLLNKHRNVANLSLRLPLSHAERNPCTQACRE